MQSSNDVGTLSNRLAETELLPETWHIAGRNCNERNKLGSINFDSESDKFLTYGVAKFITPSVTIGDWLNVILVRERCFAPNVFSCFFVAKDAIFGAA